MTERSVHLKLTARQSMQHSKIHRLLHATLADRVQPSIRKQRLQERVLRGPGNCSEAFSINRPEGKRWAFFRGPPSWMSPKKTASAKSRHNRNPDFQST